MPASTDPATMSAAERRVEVARILAAALFGTSGPPGRKHLCLPRIPQIPATSHLNSASLRAILERNSIGLLSTAGTAADSADPSSAAWLGRYASHDAVRGSSLWNVRETAGGYDKRFLDLLETCAGRTRPLEKS